MAANLMENPLKAQRLKTNQKARGMVAPFAFLFSIVFYTSIFYIFSFSPSTLFSDNKFWFFISNTLILIIAADYGAFSSSKDDQRRRDIYDEYSLHSQATRSASTLPPPPPPPPTTTGASFVSRYPESTETKGIIPIEEDVLVTETNNEIPEKILEIVVIEPKTDNFQAKNTQQVPPSPMKAAADNIGTYRDHHPRVTDKENIEPKTIQRCKSERVKSVKKLNNKKGSLLQRSNTKRQQLEEDDEAGGEHDEFSAMSNEELNRRVEEFIERFNRQIRLQGSQVLELE